MKSTMTAAVVAAMLLAAPLAQAAEDAFRTAPNSAHRIDLDTRNGAFSEWEVTELAGIDAVRADIRVRLLGEDARWAPTYALEVGTKADGARVQIFSIDRKTLNLVIYHRTGNGEWERKADAQIAVDQPVAVAFDWTAAGVVAVRAQPKGGSAVRREIRLSGAPTMVTAFASTGELTLDSIRLGSTKP